MSASNAIQVALGAGGQFVAILPIIVGGLLTLFSMWWLYFEQPETIFSTQRTAFLWGYGHLLVFAAAAGVGAGLGVTVDQITDHAAIGRTTAGAAVAIPVALYMLVLWLLQPRPRSMALPLAVLLVLLTPFTGQAPLAIGVLLAGLLGYKLARRARPALPVTLAHGADERHGAPVPDPGLGMRATSEQVAEDKL